MDRRKESTRGGIDAEAHERVKRITCAVALNVGLGVCAYFSGLAELPFGARPFGVALLAASGRGAIAVYLGLIISAFTAFEVDEAIVYFAVYSLLLLTRIFSRLAVELRGAGGLREGINKAPRGVFRERISLRVLISAIFGASLGSAILFSGGLLYYDLFALLIISALSPIGTLLLCGFFERGAREGTRGEMLFDLGFLTLSAIAVFGAAEVNLYGVSLSVLFAVTVTFFATALRGVGYGAISGLALGLCYSPMLAPLFVIMALCMGVLGRFSTALACFAAFFAASAWAFYAKGLSALVGVFGGILAGCLLYSALHKMLFFESEKKDGAKTMGKEKRKEMRCTVLPESALDGIKLYDMNARTSAISEGLRRTSLFFEELKRDSQVADFWKNHDGFCEENYNDMFFKGFDSVDCGFLSSLMNKAVQNEENQYLIDRELSEKLCASLSEFDGEILGVAVFGVRKKTIYIKGKNREKIEESVDKMVDSISSLLPFIIDRDGIEIRRDADGGVALILPEREKSSASVIRRRVTAQNETVCGDSVAIFKNDDGRFFAFISDGMGSGVTASAVSRAAVGFLSNMLSVGSLAEEHISILNGFLRGRALRPSSECSATLDLLELDLMNCRASIFKCGAAPSYIYRRGRLFKIRSESMPIGILRDADIKRFELNLQRGDIVVMVSDGVTGEGGECPWLSLWESCHANIVTERAFPSPPPMGAPPP
ncbi:MAG: SpoIIE family protein phosphatase, partial [Clostridia bacterium]|nr:SpoIIE family protein phosphatase [Clostridia bacterium]